MSRSYPRGQKDSYPLGSGGLNRYRRGNRESEPGRSKEGEQYHLEKGAKKKSGDGKNWNVPTEGKGG